MKIMHAVPNFSDGRREDVIQAVLAPLRNRPGVRLISHFPDADFNRTVVEVVGEPEALKEALLAMAGESIRLIDMRRQTGSHPRIGAQDTIPVFPLVGVTVDECRELAEEIGAELHRRYKIPVYFSGENARTPERRSLDYIRAGQYEGLREVAHTPERKPDLGPAALDPGAGATIVSSGRQGLVAYNVVLDTTDLSVAKTIARAVRGPSGGFTSVRAIGLVLDKWGGRAAVSMNMFDYKAVPLSRVFHFISSEAESRGTRVIGSEVVGTLPLEAVVDAARFFLKMPEFQTDQIIETHMIGGLG